MPILPLSDMHLDLPSDLWAVVGGCFLLVEEAGYSFNGIFQFKHRRSINCETHESLISQTLFEHQPFESMFFQGNHVAAFHIIFSNT